MKNENVSSLEHDLTLKGSRQDYLISTQKLIDDLSVDLQSVDSSIIAVDADVSFIEDLELLAEDNGLEIDIESLVVEDSPTLAAANVATLKAKIKTSGKWSGTYSFLTELESLPFKVKVNKFSMTNISKDSGLDVKKNGQQWQGGFEIVVLKYK